MSLERQIEEQLIGKLQSLKYEYRPDIRDRDGLVKNFREKFQALNRVQLGNSEFERLLDEIITPDVFAAAKFLRERNAFTRDDGTPLNYTLVNIKDWCKNTFEVVNQLRINTDNSHQRYDVILLINGVPVVQIELKSLGISPRRAMEQIVDYKNDPGNGYTKTLLCFIQLFIVSNRSDTWYFANNNSRHFSFNADERFLPCISSLLLNVRKRMGPHGIGKIFGQEKNITTYNLARMNMLLHGVKDSEFEIFHGDTLTNDWEMLRETNPAKKPYFDAVVANPPFSYRWEAEQMYCRMRSTPADQ